MTSPSSLSTTLQRLYNLIAWIIGAAEEPPVACYVDIPDDIKLKLSVCQDIVYLASKGLTLCHLTGSSNLLSLLSRLGHCASWNAVLSLDT